MSNSGPDELQELDSARAQLFGFPSLVLTFQRQTLVLTHVVLITIVVHETFSIKEH